MTPGQGTTAAMRLARAAGLVLGLLAGLAGLALAVGPGSAGAVTTKTLKIEVFGQGTVHIAPPIEGHEVCEEPVCLFEPLVEAEETLTAEPKLTPPGEWKFAGWWSSACENSFPSRFTECELKMSEDKTVEAVFENPPPLPPYITSPLEGEVIETTGAPVPVEVTFEASFPDPTIERFECEFDESGTAEECESPWIVPGVGVGGHTVSVAAIDHEGHGGEFPETHHFSVVVPSTGGGATSNPPPPFQTISSGRGSIPGASLLARWKVEKKLTLVRKLVLTRLRAGDRVDARCRGKGCPFKKKSLTTRGTTLELTKLFAKHPLRPGVVIQLRIETPGAVTQLIEIKIRAGKKPKIVRR